MARQYRKPVGRQIMWHTKVTAPPAALALYAAIAAAQKSQAFVDCHVYHGAKGPDGEPLIRFEGKVTGLAGVVASYMGIDIQRQQCSTPGCMNPFHYINSGLAQNPATKTPILGAALLDWVDLVNYAMEENVLRSSQLDFATLRPLIHADDLSDMHLEAAIKHIKEST